MSNPSRRELLQGLGGIGVAMLAGARGGFAGAQAAAPIPRFAYVGGFNDKSRNEHGDGISVFAIDAAERWSLTHVVPDVVNPGFLVLDRTQRRLYAVNQRVETVSAFRIDPASGVPSLINAESTGGVNPAHLSVDPTGRWLITVNYTGGSAAVLPIRADGGLGTRTDLVAMTGPLGPHRTEQSMPHPHHCPFDPSGRFVIVPDKGLDRVFVFRFDAASGRLLPAARPFGRARSGAGPRHVEFHPSLRRAYVVNEMDSTVTTYTWAEDGAIEPIQIVPSVPPSYTGDNTGAEVVVSRGGRLVFASNRGHDSVGVFAVNKDSGVLSPIGWEPTGGLTPRFICLSPSGRRLYAANQNGDSIVSWTVDEGAARILRTPDVVKVGCPTTIAFLSA